MAYSSWSSRSKFPELLRPISTPFASNSKQAIIYVTAYDNRHEDMSGIFELDLKSNKHTAFKLWKQKLSIFSNQFDYYPRDNTCVYSRAQNKILFVGGWNVKNMVFNYKSIIIFDVADKSMKEIKFDQEFGSCPQIALVKNDTQLHIVGGSANNNHIFYDFTTHKWTNAYSFAETNPTIQTAGLLYNKSSNTLILFGGYSFTKKVVFDDFWIFNLETLDKCNYKWIKKASLKLPIQMSLFGYVLYNDRIIITFGGKTVGRKDIDNIYYLDLLKGTWNESKVKCPNTGSCHAVLIDTTVHIIPRSSYSDHYCIDVCDILPTEILQNNNIEDMKENQYEMKQLLKQVNELLIENIILKEESNKMKLNEIKLMERISELEKENNLFIDEVKECKMELNVLRNKYNELKKNRKLDVRNYKKWTSDDVIDWIMSLEDNRFGKYNQKLVQIFNEQHIDGSCLGDVEKNDLSEWGIKDFKDKTSLFKQIRNLIMQNQNVANIPAPEGTDDTQYI